VDVRFSLISINSAIRDQLLLQFLRAWMPAASVYVKAPDGHNLEYIALLPDEPRPVPEPLEGVSSLMSIYN
jgi:hypothetical protein